MSAADGVSVSIDVAVEPHLAYEVFTREIDRWWQRGPRYRFLAPYDGAIVLEPGAGGRLLHAADGGRVVVGGVVDVWDPPRRLGFTWRLPNFAPDQVTRVDVRFDPVTAGTRVTVTHTGWDALGPEHPARHGHVGRDFVLFKGRWWADVLAALRRHVEAQPSHAEPGGTP